MTFLHTSLALAGIACIAIPIIIHLLMHRRRKPVMWGAMRFLLEAYRRQRRRLMLEKWLLLLCRCLVIALLGLAIGRPLIGKLLGPGAGRTLYILVDNSLTSGLRAPDGRTALERHKETAKSAIDAVRSARIGGAVSGEGDRVALIALGGPADGVVMPPSADLAAVARLIDDLEPTDSRADIAGGLQLVADALSGNGPAAEASAPRTVPARTYIALITDFRDGSLDLSPTSASAAAAKLPEGVTLLATAPAIDAGSPVANTAITGVEPLRAVVVSGENGAAGGAATDAGEGGAGGGGGGGNLVRVLLRRSADNLAPASTSVQTRLIWPTGAAPASATPSQPASTQATVKWAQGQDSAMVVASLPRSPMSATSASGAAAGAILVSIDDDPIAGDNSWRRPVEFREALRVGIIAPTRFATSARSGADKLDPGTWARIALAPIGDNAAGGIDVIDIEPASIDAARLAGLDAVILPRPDLIQDSGWARIGLFASSGGVVLITPPPDVSVHLWPDAMIKGLGLPTEWTVGRETRAVEGAKFVAPSSAASASSPSTSSPASPSGIASGLLALVEGELDGLLRPINIKTTLPVDNTGESGQAILKLDNGATVLWAGRPGESGSKPVPGATPRESRGLIVYLGVALSLDWSDLPAKPFMVPLMQEIVRQGVGQARGSWWMIAGARPVAPVGATELRPIDERPPLAADARTRPAGEPAARSAEIIPLISANAAPPPPIRRAGTFAAVDDRGATRAVVAINPDPRAGRVQPQPQEAVAKFIAASLSARPGESDSPDTAAKTIVWLPSDGGSAAPLDPAASPAGAPSVQSVMSSLFGSSEKGTPIELPLLIAALALAIVEIVLARWASHAEVLPAAVRQAAGAVTAGVVTGVGVVSGAGSDKSTGAAA